MCYDIFILGIGLQTRLDILYCVFHDMVNISLSVVIFINAAPKLSPTKSLDPGASVSAVALDALAARGHEGDQGDGDDERRIPQDEICESG